ncbi:MAG TPA: DUF1853 family protein [Marinobacterium sp.]|nr:DUF1853 family protein [Marinobacterium sp.]
MSFEAQYRLTRQLQWLSYAPNLVSTPDLELPQGLLGQTCFELQEHRLGARRLGLQFEQILKIYLRYQSQVTDIESNIPVRKDKITLGEADLLLRFKEQWWHIEVALKFYLRQPGVEGLAGYYGPNRRDRFDIKWQHMVNHQTQVLQQESAEPILAARNINTVRRAVLVKGWLFQHPDDHRAERPAPINPHHQRGWWVHNTELPLWLSCQPSNATYLVVEKPYWLYPLGSIAKPALNGRQLLNLLRDRTFPAQVWVVLGTGRSRQLLSRGYVVSDGWEQIDG